MSTVTKIADVQPTISKREKFIRLAQNRTTRVVKTIRLIGNLGNRSTYEYTPEDADKILGTIIEEAQAARRRMADRKADYSFKL